MRSEPEYEGKFQDGVHIVHDKEMKHIRITCNFGQINLDLIQARALDRFLGEFILELEMWNDD